MIRFIRHYPLLFVTLALGLVAGGLALTGHEQWAQWVISAYGALIAVKISVSILRDILHGKYGVDVLAVVAIISTIAVGEYWATLVIVFMMLSGEALEDFAGRRARRELTALLERAPKLTHVERGDLVEEVAIDEVQIGDKVHLAAGDMVPVDGVVERGESMLDESSLTGESEPVAITPGSKLMSGAVNGDAPIVMRATATAADSQYAQIVELVRAAGDSRAPFVRLADRYAVPFTIVAFSIAGVAWWMTGDARRFAEVLVVATPCPLLLAAPIALISGMSRAAKHGIILKSGAVLEQLSRVRTAAFDKTGTLTNNELQFSGVEPVDGIAPDELLRIAASTEQHSAHMTARAIVTEAERRHIKLFSVANAKETPGKGIELTHDGIKLLAGRLDFLQSHGVHVREGSNAGKTATHVARGDTYLGCVTFADTVRANSRETLDKLRAAGVQKLVMLTGDYRATAERIAHELGITDVHAECLPRDKLEVMKSIRERPVMMVGDGVNDAPVLAASDVGVAMGARGATAASESADAVIMLDDISRVALGVQISQHTIHIALQSVLIGIALSVALMIIAAFGWIPAVVGAALQEVVDVVVILNALRAHR